MTPKAAWAKLQEDKPRYGDWYSWEELDRTVTKGKDELGVTRTLIEVLAFVNDEEEGFGFQYRGITP